MHNLNCVWHTLVKEVATMLKEDLMGGNCPSYLFFLIKVYLYYTTFAAEISVVSVKGRKSTF